MKLLVRILKKVSLLDYLNINLNIIIWGFKWVIPLRGAIGIDHLYPSEAWFFEILQRLESLPSKSGCFVDVGVNVGQTLIKVKSLKRKIVYIGFEPNPECIYYVNELVRKNSLDETRLFPAAIGNKWGFTDLLFFNNDITDSSASIVHSYRSSESVKKKVTVPVITAEKISFNGKSLDYLKIDVEGGELEVIKEFSNLIHTYRPIIFVEILPVYQLDNSIRMERQIEMERIISELDYTLLRVNKKNGKYHNLLRIESIGVHSDLNACDYLVIPKEQVENVSQILYILQ